MVFSNHLFNKCNEKNRQVKDQIIMHSREWFFRITYLISAMQKLGR